MKSLDNFTIVLRRGLPIPYKDGDSKKDVEFVKVKKGEDIPKKILKLVIERNLIYVDVKYINKVPQGLPTDIGLSLPEVSKELKIKPRKYTQNSLTKVYNDNGFSALKKIGEEFGTTDRSYRRLIVEILKLQEERQRKGL